MLLPASPSQPTAEGGEQQGTQRSGGSSGGFAWVQDCTLGWRRGPPQVTPPAPPHPAALTAPAFLPPPLFPDQLRAGTSGELASPGQLGNLSSLFTCCRPLPQ